MGLGQGRWINAPYCIHQSDPPPPHVVFSLPLQRTHRLPKEMIPVEPSAFAAQLIAKLETLKREQDTMSSLEERLQQIQEVRVDSHGGGRGGGLWKMSEGL